MTLDTLDPRWYLVGFCLRIARDEAHALVDADGTRILRELQPLDIRVESERLRALDALRSEARAGLRSKASHATQALADHRRRLRLARRVGPGGQTLRAAIQLVVAASDAGALQGLAWWSAPNLRPAHIREICGDVYLDWKVGQLQADGLWPDHDAPPWVSARARAALADAGWADPAAWWRERARLDPRLRFNERLITWERGTQAVWSQPDGYQGRVSICGSLTVEENHVWTPSGKLRRVYLTDGSFEPAGAR